MTATGEGTWPDATEWTGKIYSGGWRQSEGGARSVNEPATGERLAEVGVAAPADVARAGALAARAQRAWAETAPQERAEVLLRAARALRDNSGAIREWIVRESEASRPRPTTRSRPDSANWRRPSGSRRCPAARS